MKSFADFLLKSGRLKWIKRSGWLREKMPEPETVAEHSWRVSLLALVLADQLGVDSGVLVKMAVLHDVEEALIGDPVTQRGKNQVGNHDKKKERRVVEKLFAGLSDQESLVGLWEAHLPENGPDKTPESDILYQLGKLATCWQVLEYELAGVDPRKCDEWWENAYAHVDNPAILGLLKEMKKLRKKRRVNDY